MILKKLFCLNVKFVSERFRVGHTEGVDVRKPVIPGLAWNISQSDPSFHCLLQLRPGGGEIYSLGLQRHSALISPEWSFKYL